MKFTPQPNPFKFDWPTDEEALAWAEAGMKHARRSLGQLLSETPLDKKQKLSPEQRLRRLLLPGSSPTLKRPPLRRCLSISHNQLTHSYQPLCQPSEPAPTVMYSCAWYSVV